MGGLKITSLLLLHFCSVAIAIPTQYVMDTAMPLPSYEQSEKYEVFR